MVAFKKYGLKLKDLASGQVRRPWEFMVQAQHGVVAAVWGLEKEGSS